MKKLLPLVFGLLLVGCSVIQDQRSTINNLPTSGCNLASSRKFILLDNPCARSGIVSEMQLNGKVDAGAVTALQATFLLNDRVIETRKVPLKKNIVSSSFKPFLEYIKLESTTDQMLLEALDGSEEVVDQLNILLAP